MFTLDEVLPWGRSFDEYRRMFDLTESDLRSRIVGCGDGPASFNAEATRLGLNVVSCDPIYRWSAPDLRRRIDATYNRMIEQTRLNVGDFVWDSIRSVDELGQIRTAAMQAFLDDYDCGRAENRYVDAGLPSLPFDDCAFDLALCSHFLFLYATQLGGEFHRAAIQELCRIATEVRIFPLIELSGCRSPFVDSAVDDLRQAGYETSEVRVPYEFRRGANQMLRIRR